jgi:hypothetical protein
MAMALSVAGVCTDLLADFGTDWIPDQWANAHRHGNRGLLRFIRDAPILVFFAFAILRIYFPSICVLQSGIFLSPG